jgi:hypothetical protein
MSSATVCRKGAPTAWMLFLGVINQGWLLITAGLYAAGYFATPAPHLQPAMSAHLESIRRSITRCYRSSRTLVVANVAHDDAEALVANGQFLEAKFREPAFLELKN